MNYKDKYILVSADYGKESVFVTAVDIELTEQEVDMLSEALWEYSYDTNFELEMISPKKPGWEFFINTTYQLDLVSKELIKRIQELFPDKLVEFSEENKYED
jgi:hypothetical protein